MASKILLLAALASVAQSHPLGQATLCETTFPYSTTICESAPNVYPQFPLPYPISYGCTTIPALPTLPAIQPMPAIQQVPAIQPLPAFPPLPYPVPTTICETVPNYYGLGGLYGLGVGVPVNSQTVCETFTPPTPPPATTVCDTFTQLPYGFGLPWAYGYGGIGGIGGVGGIGGIGGIIEQAPNMIPLPRPFL